jgi:hypothetical protein
MERETNPNPDTPPSTDIDDEDTGTLPTYVSFVLRCRATGDSGVLARLSEVRTGRSWAVIDLDELPAIVRRWVAGDADPE